MWLVHAVGSNTSISRILSSTRWAGVREATLVCPVYIDHTADLESNSNRFAFPSPPSSSQSIEEGHQHNHMTREANSAKGKGVKEVRTTSGNSSNIPRRAFHANGSAFFTSSFCSIFMCACVTLFSPLHTS